MSNKNLTFFKFDDFHLDIDERCLTFRNQPVSLTPKAFQTLVVLLRHHGKVVEKEYFLNEVWAGTLVEESTLAQNILTLRKTLSRFKNDKEFIATVPRGTVRLSRYKGLQKTRLQEAATAAAINILRTINHLNQVPVAKTRISRFARLAH